MRVTLPISLMLLLGCTPVSLDRPEPSQEIPDASADAVTDTSQDTTDPTDTSSDMKTDVSSDMSEDTSQPPQDMGPVDEGCQLTEWEQMMLDRHNAWRARVEPPAKDMHKLYWDRSIADNVAKWIESCDPEWPHSPESDRSGVGGFEVLGENLSYCAGTGCSNLPEVTDDSGLGDGDGWWEERHDYTWETDESSGVTSHYTQLTSANIYAIGCATKLCNAPGPWDWNGMWWWTACQYGPRGQAYWIGNKPFKKGMGGLIEPPDEVWKRHEGLCR